MTASPTPPDETPSSLTFFKGINAFTQLFDPIGNAPDQPPEQPKTEGESTEANNESAKNENEPQGEEKDKDAEDVVIGANETSSKEENTNIVGEEDVRVGSSSSQSSGQSQTNMATDEHKNTRYDDNDDVVVPEIIKSNATVGIERPRSSQSKVGERTGSARSSRVGSGRKSVDNNETPEDERRISSASSTRSRLNGSAKDRN